MSPILMIRYCGWLSPESSCVPPQELTYGNHMICSERISDIFSVASAVLVVTAYAQLASLLF